MSTPNLKELEKQAKELGIELNGDEKYNDLRKAIKIKEDELSKEDSKNEDSEEENDEIGKSKVIFYHVKTRAFKNANERVEIGLYKTDKEVERFEKMSDEYVEKFENKIPELELHKIAEKYRVSIYAKGGKKEVRNKKDILEELIKTL